MVLWLLVLSCGPSPTAAPPPPSGTADPQAEARARMVAEQIEARGVRDPRVLAAMREVPRHRFVPPALQDHAHADQPLPIGDGQTISQPYVVARMTEALDLAPAEKALEVGTGSGYQAAVLAVVGARVWSIEILPAVAAMGAENLRAAGYADRVRLRVGDGYRGWPEAAPFDAIVVTAAPDHVPQPLLDQLAVGGVLVLPVGDDVQELVRIVRTGPGPEALTREVLDPVRFVPMTGEAQQR